MKKHLFALLAMGIMGTAMAQTPPPAGPNVVSGLTGVATEVDASGNVLRNLRVGDVIGQGSTVSTTGTLTITSSGGACRANLASGQSMLMSATSVCDAFRTAQAGGGAGAGTGGTGSGGLFGAGLGGGLTPLALGAAGLGTLVVANAGGGTPAPISNN